MAEHLQFVLQHGYLLLFGWVFSEQMGIPVPAMPLLLAAGALAGTGRFNAIAVLIIPVCAAVAADLFWYELGRRKGVRVLQLICRISIEPDSCVRRTEDSFARRGASALLFAKFVPGLGITAAPLAGVFRMRLRRFLGMEALGAALWVSVYTGLGYIFSDQLELVAARAASLGAGLVALLAAAVAGWFAWKFIRRHRFMRQLRIDRITPEELKCKLDAGEDLVVVDLRGSMDFEADPATIPGAVHLETHEVEEVKEELAKAPEVILYCT